MTIKRHNFKYSSINQSRNKDRRYTLRDEMTPSIIEAKYFQNIYDIMSFQSTK